MSKHLLLLLSTDITVLDYELQQQIYYDFYRLVYPMVYSMLGDHAATEDVIQEAFLRAVQKPPKVVDNERLKAWLKTITRNTTYNFLKKHKKTRDHLTSAGVKDYEHHTFQDIAATVEEQVQLELMKDSIKNYASQLKPEYREILELKWGRNLTYRQMAAELGVTEGVVRQRLHRAKELVRKRLRKDWGIVE